MKQTQELFTNEQLQGIAAILNLSRESDPLHQLEYRQRLEAQKLKDETERQMKEAAKQNAEALEKKRKEDELRQEFCSHIKPNRLTHVAGQRDHSNNIIFICQGCQKKWTGFRSSDNIDGLPPHLVPDMEIIGGPMH